MFLYAVLEPGKAESIQTKIGNMGYTVTLSSQNSTLMIINLDDSLKLKQVQAIRKKIDNVSGILKVAIIRKHLKVQNVELNEALRTNKCRFVFDVDSTLTQGNPGVIHPEVEDIFNAINDKGIKIYLSTGRSMPDLIDIIKNLPVEKHSFAENGGLILGFPPDNYFEFGKIREPKKILEYLQTKYQTKEDMAQGDRFTEVIFLNKDVTLEQIEEARNTTNARIDVHPSQNSFHISERGKNKGTAMLELARRMHWGKTLIIAVGDADMDIPMFEKAGYSFAVGNATDGAKNACSQILNGKYEKGIAEIYELIRKVS